MFITKTEPFMTVPVTEGTVLTISGPAANAKKVVLYNLSDTNTMTYKFQWSDDGSTWTDVAAFTTLAPETMVSATLSSHIQHRLRAYGNLSVAVKVDSETDPLTNFSFFAV